jgi:DNA-binding response OmpR family regulator
MSGRILSVSYDQSLLATRQIMLEQKGYKVTSALGFTAALEHCTSRDFDLFILGHSIPTRDKEELVAHFRQNCPAPVLSLERMGEPRMTNCDFHVSPDEPEQLLEKVTTIFQLSSVYRIPQSGDGKENLT